MIGRVVFSLATLVACALAVDISILSGASVRVNLQTNQNGGFNLLMERNGVSEIIAVVGRNIGATLSSVQGTSNVAMRFENDTTLTISSEAIVGQRSGHVVTLAWNAPKTTVLEDCASLGSHHWYGGPQQKRQYWPIERLVLPKYSYVTKEADNCGVAESYWLSSEGIFYFIDKKVPLFVDQNNKENNAACFIAEVAAPYSSNRANNSLEYVIGIFDDVRQAHEYAVETYLKKPTGIPDELMIKYPIWSTWAKYKSAIDHDVVQEFADQIIQYGFPNSQYEIDDLWEICYGSQTVDVLRFPDMRNTISTLKSKGFRVTMWTHPFLNKGCEPWYTEATTNGYVVSSESGNVETSWWNDNGTTTSYVDFTKPAAREWYVSRLRTLQSAIGVDSFKFDGGESSWSPQIPVLQAEYVDQPGAITSDYVRAVANFGNLVEVRAGYRTQDLPIFVRMIDKDSNWDFENGLATLITTTLQLNINGYPLVLPDMIGGNGYNGAPNRELFIRWLQATTFLPSLQFSYVPWDYDSEIITISKKFVDLHAQYAPQVVEACHRAVSDGAPVNPPLWWIAPNDTETYDIWDQYLLGETIIVAPVVLEGATTRSIYLPEGVWYDQGDTSKEIQGPTWVRDYPAPIDVLPFFVLKPNSQAAVLASVSLLLFALAANVLHACLH